MPSWWERLGFNVASVEERSPTPFTTQAEVLTKYKQGTNVKGELVGMCDPMTNVYLGLVLDAKNPSEVLADDKRFLIASIHAENAQLKAEKEGHPDIHHHAFTQRNIPHHDLQVEKTDLTPNKMSALLNQGQHLIITYPTITPPDKPQLSHQAYLGREGVDLQHGCRFFDANVRGGERKGSCSELVDDFVQVMRKQYTLNNEPFTVGVSTP
jgi:hypothetical protein